MKLLTKTGLNFISASVFFFLFGSLGGYYFIRFAVNKFLNDELKEARSLVDSNLNSGGPQQLTHADVWVDTIPALPATTAESFGDTLLLNTSTNNYEFHRKLTYYKQQNNAYLKVTIIRPTAPSDLLVMKFTLMLTVFPVLFFLILYMVNRQTTKHSLAVFYDTIKKLKGFDVNKSNQLELMTSDVDEFEQLKEVFKAMDEKIKEDYERLKQYTENTSHELQTPLAIINSKLDELLQASNLTEEQIKLVAGVIETTSRLSKINQALIFLAKLDNRLFGNEEPVMLDEIVKEHLEHLEPLIEDKELDIKLVHHSHAVFSMNRSLAHTMIQNLLKNAIRHNISGGYVKITFDDHQLSIENSGNQLDLNPDEMFHRFRKDSSHPQSMGIGLSIVKQTILRWYPPQKWIQRLSV